MSTKKIIVKGKVFDVSDANTIKETLTLIEQSKDRDYLLLFVNTVLKYIDNGGDGFVLFTEKGYFTQSEVNIIMMAIKSMYSGGMLPFIPDIETVKNQGGMFTDKGFYSYSEIQLFKQAYNL